jgi:hypothetical protein
MCRCASWCVDEEVEVLSMRVYMPTGSSPGYHQQRSAISPLSHLHASELFEYSHAGKEICAPLQGHLSIANEQTRRLSEALFTRTCKRNQLNDAARLFNRQ